MTELNTLELDILRASAGQVVQLPYEKMHEMAEATSRLKALGLISTGYDDDQPTALATEAGRAHLATVKAEQIKELSEIAEMFRVRIQTNGEWDDGCFYYRGTSASELQEPLRRARAAMQQKDI